MPLFSVGAKINKMLPDDKTVFLFGIFRSKNPSERFGLGDGLKLLYSNGKWDKEM